MIKELALKNRSVRRYRSDVRMDSTVLRELVDIARICPNAGNLQRIRFATVTDEENTARVREALRFAAYLKGWDGPSANENPAAYVILLSEDEDVNLFIDLGIAAEAVLLGAVEMGYNGCLFRSFDAQRISEILGVDSLKPRLVISLGASAECVELCGVENGDIKYYRRGDIHVVPKRNLSDVLVVEK